jgi:quinol monooxygenase YgiN
MRTKIIIFFCVAAMMAACCNKGSQNADEKACCKHAKSEGAACCKQEKAGCADAKKIISARIFIKPEKVADFIAATQSLLEASRAEAGNVSYSLFQDPQDASKFFFFEEWKNQEAVDFHFATDHFKKFGETLNECASQPAVITIYDSNSETKV